MPKILISRSSFWAISTFPRMCILSYAIRLSLRLKCLQLPIVLFIEWHDIGGRVEEDLKTKNWSTPPLCMAEETPMYGWGEDDSAAVLPRALPRLECLTWGPSGKPKHGPSHISYPHSFQPMTASCQNTCTDDALGFLPLKHILALLRSYEWLSLFRFFLW